SRNAGEEPSSRVSLSLEPPGPLEERGDRGAARVTTTHVYNPAGPLFYIFSSLTLRAASHNGEPEEKTRSPLIAGWCRT
ncbi:MAG TPA: hypothetical protein VNT52_12615, partial [Acidimicrobiales bacterium]|nr:hypothetical protein [Acidimicrobiales bacterium]